jgi:hypothetical protein
MMTTAVIGTVISNASRDARRRRLWVVEGRHGEGAISLDEYR